MSRLAFVMSVGILAVCVYPASAEKITVRDSWTPSALQAGWHCGIEKGFFKDLEITHEDGNGSTTTVTLIANKSFDVGWGDLSTMAVGRGKGMKVVSVMGLLRKTQLGIFVPEGSGLKTAKDLEGKTVLYTATSVEGPYLDAFFAAGGTDRSKIDLVNVDSNAKMSSYASGKGDGVITTIPFGAPLVNPHRKSTTIEFANYGFVLPGYGMYVHEDTLRNKPATIQKAVEGMIAAWDTIIKDGGAEECADIIIKRRPDAKLVREQLIEQIKLHVPYFYTTATKDKPLGWQAEGEWGQTVKNLEQAKLIPAGSKATDYFTNSFVKQ